MPEWTMITLLIWAVMAVIMIFFTVKWSSRSSDGGGLADADRGSFRASANLSINTRHLADAGKPLLA
jgi:hypothetical protein